MYELYIREDHFLLMKIHQIKPQETICLVKGHKVLNLQVLIVIMYLHSIKSILKHNQTYIKLSSRIGIEWK